MNLEALLSDRLAAAFAAVAGAAVDPVIRPSQHADLQSGAALALARELGRPPREIAAEAAAKAELAGLATVEVSGPGFLNVTFAGEAIWRQVTARLGDQRLGVPAGETGSTTVIDYSQPNIAKEMHVGHLRSTVIGDALARTLGFLGATVIRQNHLGDWGTQFGMLIQHLFEHPADQPAGAAGFSALYRTARARFDADAAFAGRARRRVVDLQAGDPGTLAVWQQLVDESKIYFNEVYGKLGVLLDDADAVGESFYNHYLQDIADDLENRGIAVRSDGALCVFFDDANAPLIVRKSDGGFGYAATDLAAIRYRVTELSADRILYVVDARQALHFRMVFETARRAGYLPGHVRATHVPFGTVLGEDGRPFKTRSGETVQLIALLDAAVDRARATVASKNPELGEAALDERAAEVGIGAVKYADLSTGRTRDYVFDLDRMVSLQGNTGVYLQYANARIQSILRKAGVTGPATVDESLPLAPAERQLALQLDEIGTVLTAVAETAEPHRLAAYLYAVAQAFSEFYEACPVLRAPSPEVRHNRLALCELTSRTLELGLHLLGVAAPARL
ncbi:arginine--tRNA ligase [Actinoplanes sp. NPDC026619]|uniref:arginine--tRNA ligase n=1 Tax=Actinoplanes sp. NPDC026619 TaxID=3155798 RepID=UPI0033E35C03